LSCRRSFIVREPGISCFSMCPLMSVPRAVPISCTTLFPSVPFLSSLFRCFRGSSPYFTIMLWPFGVVDADVQVAMSVIEFANGTSISSTVQPSSAPPTPTPPSQSTTPEPYSTKSSTTTNTMASKIQRVGVRKMTAFGQIRFILGGGFMRFWRGI